MACLELNLEHPLLEATTPAYTHATIRRAFIVWLRCGQTNTFRDVCDYYHRLEALEDQLPADTRASSRHHEFSLFVSNPPTSPFQQQLFPQLYSNIQTTPNFAQTVHNYCQTYQVQVKPVTHQEIFDTSQVFKSDAQDVNRNDGWNGMKGANSFLDHAKIHELKTEEAKKVTQRKDDIKLLTSKKERKTVLNEEISEKDHIGTTKQEIVETSQMIRNYCKEQQIPLRNFLESFKEYAGRCELNNTVNNVGFYIKRKMIYEELKLAVKVFRAKNDFVVNERRLERQEALRVIVTENSVCAAGENKNVLLNNLLKPKGLITDVKTTDTTTNNEVKDLRRIKKDNLVITENLEKNSTGFNEKCIKLLKRNNTESKLMNVDFSSTHLVKIDVQKCRKI